MLSENLQEFNVTNIEDFNRIFFETSIEGDENKINFLS
jgi:hypothetical protein